MADRTGRDLQRDLGTLTDLAKRDLQRALARARTPEHARSILNELLPALIDQYGSAAATLAAEWYDEVRADAAARGAFRAIIPDMGNQGVQALIGWALDTATDLKTFESLTLGGSVRRILNYGRATIAHSAVRDPGAQGWQRIDGGGDGSCPFCRMLIGRGAVYTEASVRFASHDHCNCATVAVFNGQDPLPIPEYVRSQRTDRTEDEQRRASNERVRAWLEANPDVG